MSVRVIPVLFAVIIALSATWLIALIIALFTLGPRLLDVLASFAK